MKLIILFFFPGKVRNQNPNSFQITPRSKFNSKSIFVKLIWSDQTQFKNYRTRPNPLPAASQTEKKLTAKPIWNSRNSNRNPIRVPISKEISAVFIRSLLFFPSLIVSQKWEKSERNRQFSYWGTWALVTAQHSSFWRQMKKTHKLYCKSDGNTTTNQMKTKLKNSQSFKNTNTILPFCHLWLKGGFSIWLIKNTLQNTE